MSHPYLTRHTSDRGMTLLLYACVVGNRTSTHPPLYPPFFFPDHLRYSTYAFPLAVTFLTLDDLSDPA